MATNSDLFTLNNSFEYFRTVRAAQDRRLLMLMETGGHDRYEEEGLLGNRPVHGEGEREDDIETESAPIHTFRRRGVPPAMVGRGASYYQFLRAVLHSVEVFCGFFLSMYTSIVL
ncbi:hypothetical protein SpCBS45565_g02939 [Spizellomyces sp. 'palustris']|nr:hypothetical protein SpCBS45565_g02939 [Spizellomyces sp. 'palustris']